jgi:5-methylcytosine-specific restriction endonuclease McrA
MIRKHRPELGWDYQTFPKPFFFVDRPRPVRGVTPGLRFAILERDGFRCRYCGAPAPEVRLHVDHVIPVIAGGSDDPENLVAACEDCNLGKSARVLVP